VWVLVGFTHCSPSCLSLTSLVLAAKRMVERSLEGFDLYPAKLIGDTAYGTAENLAWLVHERDIEPHIPVFDKSQHADGTFSPFRGGRTKSRETWTLRWRGLDSKFQFRAR
jgi:hypothetical protein